MSDILGFLTSQIGFLITGVLLASAIVIWDWRYALLTVMVVQVVVGAATIQFMQAPFQWVIIQMTVMALSCAIIGLSAARTMSTSPTALQSGSWWLRLMAVLLMYGGWRLLDIRVEIPEVNEQLIQMFGWIAGCALLILGLGMNPLYASIALLLWLIPVQAYVAAIVEIPTLVVLVGMLQILIALAGSYLLVAEDEPEPVVRTALTDVAFPADIFASRPIFGLGTVADSLEATVRRRWLARDEPATTLEDRGDTNRERIDSTDAVDERSIEDPETRKDDAS